MEDNFNIQEYLANGVENLLKNAVRTSLKNPKESIYLLNFSKHARKATELRKRYSQENQNIPAFLIASITSRCNLHCAGCYSRANDACNDNVPISQLTGEDWNEIFKQAKNIGISFIVLAGGEPLIRKDVIDKAINYPEILFPIFTNGTMITEEYLKLFDDNRNLVPVISIEGNQESTDLRRGTGVYNQVINSMSIMNDNNIIFGASLTFTKGNLSSLLSDEYITQLHDYGCKVIFFIEYVPIDEQTKDIAPTDYERQLLLEKLQRLRKEYSDMLFISFPGDEKTSGGCLAAGRGFFHINSHGGAEPCPASPYSDINVKDTSLLDALNSKLFKFLREGDMLLNDHEGGCVLFEHKEEVEQILKEE